MGKSFWPNREFATSFAYGLALLPSVGPHRRMKSRPYLATLLGSIAILAATAGIGWGLVWYKGHQAELAKMRPPPAENPESVVFDVVSEIDFQPSTTAIGTIVAPQWMSLRSEASGRVITVNIQSGSTVKKGDVMIALDSSVERASLKAARAKLDMAKRSMDRIATLSDSGSVSSQELEQSRFDQESALAEIERLEAVIARRTMIAPYDARVGLINVSLGQYISEGLELTTLTGITDELFVDFAVPQYIASFIDVGQEVQVRGNRDAFQATIVAIDARSDRLTRNLMVRAVFSSTGSRIMPNDSVQVTLVYGPKTKALAIPAAALLRTPTESQVFVVSDASGVNRAERATITTSGSMGGFVVVSDGLAVGQRIISQGAFKLRPGQAVRDVSGGSDMSTMSSDATPPSVLPAGG